MSALKKLGVCAGLLLLISVAAISQSGSVQVVFSKTGGVMTLTGNTVASATPFGFWIWCGGAAPTSNGGYQADCQGSTYFYALTKPATHVIGTVAEGPDGIYTMNVVEGTAAQLFSNTLHPAYSCSLTNTTPGGGDSVKVSCLFIDPALGGGMGKAAVTSAIVNITGP